MAKNDNLTDFLTDVANAIREKKGTTDLINPQNFSAEIASIETGGGGGGGAAAGAVNFRDYDGTILHSFSKDEFLAMSELPELPTQAGLICQEWNWSLEDAKAYVEDYGVLDIGATYITDDGITRLHINIATEGRMKMTIYFQQTIANGVSFDWGDGSNADSSISGTGKVKISHTYSSIGHYTISLNVAEGCVLKLGQASASLCIFGNVSNVDRVYCNMLEKIEIGKGVVSIEDYAFQKCNSLASVVIPNSVTSIGKQAFYYCYSLASVVIPNSVTSLGTDVFASCNSLTSVVIPNGVTSIGTSAFQSCYSLASVVIPNGVTSIGTYAFATCYSLASVVIPNSVTSLGNYAFQSCYSLTSVVIPNSVTSIGTYAFQKCYSLTSVVIPNGVTSLSNYIFSDCYSLTSVVIPNGVKSIGNNAFCNCYSLASVVIPNSVTSLGNYAFTSCHSLASVVIPNGVTSIGTYTFATCYSLASVVIPNGVKSIGNNAFYGDTGLAYVDFSAHTSVPTLSATNALGNGTSDRKIIVPDALYDEWVGATNWSSYASQIIKASEYNG